MEIDERIHSIQNGDSDLFELVVEKYKNKIYALAYGYTRDDYLAQDLAQDIFIKIYQNIKSFQGQSTFSTWLYRVAKNHCIDWIRKNKKSMEDITLDKGKLDIEDERIGPEGETINKEKHRLLYEAIDQLPDKYKSPLMLFHFQGLSYDEIGKVLDIPSKTVATQLYRGKKILRDKLITKGRGEMLWTALL